MWSALASAVEWVLGLLFGPKTDPAVQGEALGVAKTVATSEGNAVNEISQAQSARTAADERSIADPSKLRDPDPFSRD